MRPSRHLVYVLAVSLTLLSAAGRVTAQITITPPTSSTAKPGDTITITGTNFGPAATTSTVKFGSTLVPVEAGSWSNTSIKVTVPDVGLGVADLVVSVGAANSAPFPFVLRAPATTPTTTTPQVIQPA